MRKNKKVTFGDITIQRYPIELGDNPSCSAGAPVQIGWEPQAVEQRNLDLYEYMRGKRRRTGKELEISVQRRAQLLFSAGYTLDQIADATMQVLLIKKLRTETLRNQGWDRVYGYLQATGKLPRGLLESFASLVSKSSKKTVQARSA